MRKEGELTEAILISALALAQLTIPIVVSR
jgi:hypothetical protein